MELEHESERGTAAADAVGSAAMRGAFDDADESAIDNTAANTSATPVESVPRAARARAREEVVGRIVAHARGQLRSAGPGELSLRAIARDLGMVPSGIYRYVASRDELLTALLVEVYEELGDVLEGAAATVSDPADAEARFTALARALRSWAVAHPHDWALLYGSPVPGYSAPVDTIPASGRATGAFLAILVDLAREDGEAADARGGPDAPVGPAARASVAGIRSMLPMVGEGLILRGMAAWSAVMGSISLELFGHLKNGVLDYDAYFDEIVRLAARTLIGR